MKLHEASIDDLLMFASIRLGEKADRMDKRTTEYRAICREIGAITKTRRTLVNLEVK